MYAFFCIAVYCLWAVMLTQDGCHSLTWNPFSIKPIYEIFWQQETIEKKKRKAKFRKNTAAKKHDKAVLREMTFLNECANCCFFRASVTQQILIFYVFLGAPCKYTRKIGYTFLARVDIKFTMSRFSIFKEKFYTFRNIKINR